jgi:uncharacterized membrane protein YjfL (UPF0719 family)
MSLSFDTLFNATVFTALGIVFFFVAFAILRAIVPGNLWKQVVEERNMALAVLAGLICVGLCIIIAATLH